MRIPLNVAPAVLDGHAPAGALPQHVALTCTDAIGLARAAKARGMTLLPIPDNSYDDLAARFDLDAGYLAELRELDLLYDRDGEGEYVHFYTRTVGNLFWEFVERRGGYDGFGPGNAPVRLSAQGAAAGR